jgi:hypothetical protein
MHLIRLSPSKSSELLLACTEVSAPGTFFPLGRLGLVGLGRLPVARVRLIARQPADFPGQRDRCRLTADMKKLLIALLVLFLLAGVAAVGVGYYVYRQVRSTVTQFAELGQVPEIERGVRARGGYAPPPSEELTESQVARLVKVQEAVRARLGERIAEFERKYKALSEKEQAALSDAPSIIAAYRDLATMLLDAKRAQVDALNQADLSLEEYRWIRSQAYRALGAPYVDLDIGRLIEDAKSGKSTSEPGQLQGALGPAGPEVNRKLIEGVKKQLEQNLALASFGL